MPSERTGLSKVPIYPWQVVLPSILTQNQETQSASAAGSASKPDSQMCEDCSKLLSSEVQEIDLKYVIHCTEDWSEDRELGEGGFGKIFKAVDQMARPSVGFAAKRLDCTGDNDQAFLKEITDADIKTLTAFTHPNIIRLLGYCKTENMAVFLYEYEPNGSLDTHLVQDDLASKLSWQGRAKVVNGLLSAIKHLHTYDPRGPCYHRDVKPGNIILTEMGDAKLVDCGLAEMVTIAATRTGKTLSLGSTGLASLGTPGFVCAEYENTGEFNEKSEVYSIGITTLQTLGTLNSNDTAKKSWTRGCARREAGAIIISFERSYSH